MLSNQDAFNDICDLADALQDADDCGSDKEIGFVPDELYKRIIRWARQRAVTLPGKDGEA